MFNKVNSLLAGRQNVAPLLRLLGYLKPINDGMVKLFTQAIKNLNKHKTFEFVLNSSDVINDTIESRLIY